MENIKEGKGTEKEKNIMNLEKQYMTGNFYVEYGMEKEKNIINMENWHLKGNF